MGVILGFINDYDTFLVCRLVSKTFLHYLPIKQHERCLTWVENDKENPYQVRKNKDGTFTKHGYELKINHGKIDNMFYYCNGLRHGLGAYFLVGGSGENLWLRLYKMGNSIGAYDFYPNEVHLTISVGKNGYEHRIWKGNTLVFDISVPNYIYSEWFSSKSGMIHRDGRKISLSDIVPDPKERERITSSYSARIGKTVIWKPREVMYDYLPNGICNVRTFHTNGKTRSSFSFLFNKRHGYKWVYDRRGNLLYHDLYNVGELLNFKQYHRNQT